MHPFKNALVRWRIADKARVPWCILQRRAAAHIKSEQKILSELCSTGLSNRVSHGARLSGQRQSWNVSDPFSNKQLKGFCFFFFMKLFVYQWITSFLECGAHLKFNIWTTVKMLSTLNSEDQLEQYRQGSHTLHWEITKEQKNLQSKVICNEELSGI